MTKDTENTMFYGASPEIFEYAWRLRQKLTPSEAILWDVLKGKQLGVKFRRQHPLNNYIADFYCHEKRLIIEIDGGYHLESEQKAKDEVRSQDIESFGIKVIRFTNDEVNKNITKVIEKIKYVIDHRTPNP